MRPTQSALLVFSIALGAAGATTSAATAAPPPATCPIEEAVYERPSPRIQRGSITVGGRDYRFSVLLPTDYARTPRTYPVLYWLHGAGGNQDSAYTHPQTPRFMEDLTADKPVIVVIPEGGFVGMYSDWGTPGHQWETAHMQLIKHIDAIYRTRAGRKHRAVAGFSMGGMGAIAYTARHPRLFTAAASFSGLLDTSYRSPSMKLMLTVVGPVLVPACAGQVQSPFGPWGDPVTNRRAWEAHNPTALVRRLRGKSIYVATGDGRPCDAQDRRDLALGVAKNPLLAVESMVRDANETFHRAMTDAQVPHMYNAYGCGIHSWRYWERELRAWWPRMMRAFG